MSNRSKSKLKIFRKYIAVFVFIITTLLFVELSGNYTKLFSDYVLFFQFIPSLLSFINTTAIAATGFIIVLLLSFLFGRVYCSFLCPLGILIDLINRAHIKISKLRRKKLKYKFLNPLTKTRNIILTITTILILAGSSTAIVLLDPYSNFGRILTNFVRPIFLGINNFLVIIFEQFDNYSLVPHGFQLFGIGTVLITLSILGLIIWLTYKNGRLYCNSICPVGTLLGYFSKYSLYKIKITDDKCIDCGLCEKTCKAGCLDADNKFIDYSRCVSCFNCIDSCSTDAIIFDKRKRDKQDIDTDEQIKDKSKRKFLSSVGIAAGLMTRDLFAQEKIKVYKENKIPEKKNFPLSPPGSLSIKHFTENCTACTLCVSACPTNVLQPSIFTYGISGLLMPEMDPDAGYCNYECTICGDVCPNDAILPHPVEEKKLIQVGKAKFERDNCVVITQKTECGACTEHCPTKAVTMVVEEGLRVPKVKDEICIGCGACEHACPTIPYKAIYVDGNAIHQIAEKPTQEDKMKEADTEEDFPF